MIIRKIYGSATFFAFTLACTWLILQYLDLNPLSFETTSYVILIGTILFIALTWLRTIVLAKENRGPGWTTYTYARPQISLSHFTLAISMLLLSNVVESQMTDLLWNLGIIGLGGVLINYLVQYLSDYPRFAINDKQLVVYGSSYSTINISDIKEVKQQGNYLQVQTQKQQTTIQLKYMKAEEQEQLLKRLQRSLISAIMDKKERSANAD